MSLPAYFLDTNVLVAAFLNEASDSRRLLELGSRGRARLLTSDYVLRELRFALVKKLRVPQAFVDSFVLDVMAPSLLILRKPSPQEVRSFGGKIRDRSDIPIVTPCVKHGLTLVTLDSRLARSARELINVTSPRETIKGISRST